MSPSFVGLQATVALNGLLLNRCIISHFNLGTQSGLLQSCNVADFPVFSVNIKGKNGYYTGQEVIYHNRIAIKTYLTQNEHTRTFLEGTQSFLFSVNP